MKTNAFARTYAGRKVLDLPAITLQSGAVTAVIGANGSGKSTMAKILAGIETADDSKRAVISGRVGYLPQKPFAFRMTVEQNLALNGGDEKKRTELS